VLAAVAYMAVTGVDKESAGAPGPAGPRHRAA
jgi:hypothetical protein